MARVFSFRPEANTPAHVRQDLTDSLYRALRGAEEGKLNIPSFVQLCFKHRVWAEERILAGGTVCPPTSFHEWVHAPYPTGLGFDYATVRQYLVHDNETLALWDAAVARQHGGDRRSAARTKMDNIHLDHEGPPKTPDGTSAERAIRRLRKAAETGDEKAASLYQRVIANEVAPNRAAIEMGWRKPTATIVDLPDAAYAHAKKHLGAVGLAERAFADLTTDQRWAFFEWAAARLKP
jgi:hypothetical protein